MNYTKLYERGRGGFGVVDEVIGDDGQLYAKKTLVVPSTLNITELKPRFEREIKYQSAINHENIVQIIEYDINENPPWFVMPLAECSLADEMKKDKTLGSNLKIVLFHVLNGLEEIHRRGYYHRDLKPGNVLKFKKPSGEFVYALSDFGLLAVGEDASTKITPSGMAGGTLLYQAPECAINFKRATPKSDIYSFGAMLHDIFSPNQRKLPHEELTVPGEMGAVVSKCTKRNSHRRYKNVEEVREALFNVLSTYMFKFESIEEQIIVDLLKKDDPNLSPDQWDTIFDFIDENAEEQKAISNVFRALRRDHIEHLFGSDPDLMSALGKSFADYCREGTFDFDYCDVIAAKAQLFYDFGEVGLKADIAVAMLHLGTGHNRWFVERKFLQMAGPAISEMLAQRIVVEMAVLKTDFDDEFAHLQLSIHANVEDLHPVIRNILNRA